MTNSRAKSSGVLMLTTAVLVTGAIIAPAQRSAKSITPTKTQPPSASHLVTIIDGVLQPRFQQDAGVFGMSRTYGVDVIGGHQYVLNKGSVFQKTTMDMPITTDVGREYIIGFFRFAKKPGRYVPDAHGHAPQLVKNRTRPVYQEIAWQQPQEDEEAQKVGGIGTPRFYADHEALQKAVQSVCLNALPDVKQGKSCNVTRSGYLIAVRPIKAAKASCLHCHAGAKLNDALGAMVYTVRLDTAATKITARAF